MHLISIILLSLVIMLSSFPNLLKTKIPSTLIRNISSFAYNASKPQGTLSQQMKSRISKPNEKPPFLMIASLGNPGKKYASTRHSVGHHMLQEYAKQHGFNGTVRIGSSTFISNPEIDNVVLFQSPSYMNLSGAPISTHWSNVVRFMSENYNPVLIILHDELDVDVGKIKIRKQGASANGHNGLKSLHYFLGKGFTSIQIGIGRYYKGDHKRDPTIVPKYVLKKFKYFEVEVLDTTTFDKMNRAIEQMRKGQHIFDSQ